LLFIINKIIIVIIIRLIKLFIEGKTEGVEDQEEDVSSDWINLRARDYSGN